MGRCAEAAGVARWRWGAGVGRVRPMRGRAGKGGGALGCRGVGWGAPAGAAAHGGFVGPPPGCCCAEDESDLDDFEEGDDLGGEPACCLPHLLPCTAASSLPCGFTPRGQPAALVVGWARRAGGGRRRCCRRPARQLRPTLCEVAAYRRADVARPLNRPFPAAQTTWRSGNTRSSRRGRTRRRGRRGEHLPRRSAGGRAGTAGCWDAVRLQDATGSGVRLLAVRAPGVTAVAAPRAACSGELLFSPWALRTPVHPSTRLRNLYLPVL